MAYNNLKAEMRRIGKVQLDVAQLLKTDLGTANRKVNHKSKFTLDEALAIQQAWFPHLTIEYLFSTDKGE